MYTFVSFSFLSISILIPPKFMLCVLTCHWLEFFPMFNSLANSHHPLPLAAKLIRSTLSFKDNVLRFNAIFYPNQLTPFSIPNSPGHLNTHAITVNIYRSIGISKQSLPTCMHISIYYCLGNRLNSCSKVLGNRLNA